ncbi:MAG: S8 family peptidase [Geminocystis sp.]|nr:S8 family peptidase [Geminocystis sp.]HIK37293.1 peptidase S8 [Geminocystis sp. M7585_C2015_104]MCS7148248.1 S8 family peptidase [Geminocystis sp.]MCX8077663.1 S8 family peptidase [Geminocystis sp.]MDW8116555.1 S8 family peptidase [Geminocystis sp.]
MRKFLLVCLCILGVALALFNFRGLALKGEYDSLIINFREDIPKNELESSLQLIASQIKSIPVLNSIFSEEERVYVVKGDKNTWKQLKKLPLKQQVEYIEPNYVYHSLEVPNDPGYSQQWNLRSINIEQAWDDSKGEGVIVAVIDTGVTQVPDLGKTEFVEGYNFIDDNKDTRDDVGHGTHVAGTIAQSTNNNYGVAGIAYRAKIMPLKVLGKNGGTVADIAEAIKFAADRGAGVINMSFGGGGDSRFLREAIKYAHQKGVVMVAAAGNENRNAATYPARYPEVIAVSATDAAGNKAPYSNFGAGVDISAPGGSETGKIVQETINGESKQPEFIGYMGTSMASPHVAGVAALIKATGVDNPDEVRAILLQSARKPEKDPLNHYGAGQLDAARAVKLALKGKITLRDFLRWLRDNGYLNPGFWIDGGAVALLPKILMVLGSYLFAWFLRNYLPFNLSLQAGLIVGSSGLFFLQGFYIFDLPQWPFRLMGSSIPELGNILWGSSILNPLFASALIPTLNILIFLQHPTLKWLAIGCSLGVASCLLVSAFTNPWVWGLGYGWLSRLFLLVNALFCLLLANLAAKAAASTSFGLQ